MALQSSGQITLKEIATEFGDTAPSTLKEFYSAASGIPASGEITIKDFYGASSLQTFTISSNQQEMNLSTYLTAQGWDGSSNVDVTINSGVYIWSDNTGTGALTIPSSMNGLVTITNNGYIIGRGGDGGANDGGPAIVNNATGVTLTNASGAYIAGGGGGGAGGVVNGGGGGGAGGGDGQVGAGFRAGATAGTGGAVGQAGTNASHPDGTQASGGGAGGGGSRWHGGSGSQHHLYGGGGGGRILPGTGGAGGQYVNDGTNSFGGTGGSAGNAGGAGNTNAAGGGGGWGAAGGSGGQGAGGAGGAAISGTAIATYTNNGTVYGAVA